MQFVRSAKDERDFRSMRSMHFEELKGKRRGEYSLRLNDQFRLVMTLEGRGPTKKVRITGIEDYH